MYQDSEGPFAILLGEPEELWPLHSAANRLSIVQIKIAEISTPSATFFCPCLALLASPLRPPLAAAGAPLGVVRLHVSRGEQ